MQDLLIVSIIMTTIAAATPLLLAGLGELVAEKAGVLNLGVEGMMLVGAVVGFIAAHETGSSLIGVLAAAVAGACAALLFGVLTIGLASNQVATGLALTLFGIGFSALIGEPYVGQPIDRMGAIFPEALSDHSIGKLIFGHDPLVYFALIATFAVGWFLRRTRPGLVLRAVGENDLSAHSIGYSVRGARYAAVLFGGAMAGIGGSYFSLVVTPSWTEELTAGRGWIAVALVVFAAWRPGRLMLGALLFGAVATLDLHAQAAGIDLFAPEFLAAAPYLATIVVLALLAARRGPGAEAPASLGKPFTPPA